MNISSEKPKYKQLSGIRIGVEFSIVYLILGLALDWKDLQASSQLYIDAGLLILSSIGAGVLFALIFPPLFRFVGNRLANKPRSESER